MHTSGNSSNSSANWHKCMDVFVGMRKMEGKLGEGWDMIPSRFAEGSLAFTHVPK